MCDVIELVPDTMRTRFEGNALAYFDANIEVNGTSSQRTNQDRQVRLSEVEAGEWFVFVLEEAGPDFSRPRQKIHSSRNTAHLEVGSLKLYYNDDDVGYSPNARCQLIQPQITVSYPLPDVD